MSPNINPQRTCSGSASSKVKKSEMNSEDLFLEMVEREDLTHCVFIALIRVRDQQREGDKRLLQELEQQDDGFPS